MCEEHMVWFCDDSWMVTWMGSGNRARSFPHLLNLSTILLLSTCNVPSHQWSGDEPSLII